jgi:small subunit ribosomal protein YMR-31
MNATKILLQQRQPMIKFIGKRTTPAKLDHTPHTHPAAPSPLPNTFATYRQTAQQHGPLNTKNTPGYRIGSHSGASLGPVEPAKGVNFDRSELPGKYQRMPWTLAEIEAVESGGASVWVWRGIITI